MKRYLVIVVVQREVEAANEELARAVAALDLGLPELPESAIVQELAA
ncbi:hypothetical protein [Lysobacter enzymogenes]|nr:hypothetical protein [Lysobacter enzymogenes]QQP96512.1 hypothetical protein JHW38_00180 [Lysobacter enzymogenes]